MKTLIRSTLPLVAVALLLVGCSSISSGTITEKNHSEGYYYTTFICGSYNSQGLCTVQVPIQNHQPPTWSFDITEGKDTGWVYVSEDTYNRYSVGDYYTDPEG